MLHKKYVVTSTITVILFFHTLCLCTVDQTKNQSEFLYKPISVKLPEKFKNTVDVSLLIADLKYDGNSLKVLELGNVTSSILSSHESVYGTGIIWERIYNYVKGLGPQLWCIGQPLNPKSGTFICFENFVKRGARNVNNLEQLADDPVFVDLCHADNSSKKFSKISDYKGILAPKSYSSQKEDIAHLKKEFPDFLLLNEVAHVYGTNKYKTAILFHDEELSQFKPKWKAYPKIYSKYIVNKIEDDFTSNILVIKPINAALGKGVLIIEKKDLDKTLETIFTKQSEIENIKDSSYNYWAKDGNSVFLVESFEPAKPVTLHGKEYDAKTRVIFALSCDQGNATLTFFGAYHKAAFKSLDENCSLTEKHKSKICEKTRAAKVSHEDSKKIQEILGFVFPKMYIKMMEVNENMDFYLTLFKKINRHI